MADTEMPLQVSSPRRTRRLTLRRALRAALGMILAAIVLYALLPWLLPKRWLADRIAAEVSRVMNRGARIERLEIGWVEGVVLEGFTIDERPGFGPGPFIRVRKIRTEFSPLKMLLGKPISTLRLIEPDVWVVILTENGVQRLNIADLGAEGTQTAPTGEWSAVRAGIHIVDERVEAPSSSPTSAPTGSRMRNEVSLRLGQLACRLDAKTGLASWDIRGLVPPGSDANASSTQAEASEGIVTDGQLSVPKLKKGIELSGGGRIAWHRLDLASVPVHLIPGSSFVRMTGWSAGALDVQVHEDLRIDFRFNTDLAEVAVYREGSDRPSQLAKAGLTTQGRWDPTIDVLVLDDLDCHLPGLHVQGRKRPDRSPVRLALRSDHRIDVELGGEADDLDQLRQSLPELDTLLGRQTETHGACRFGLDWRRTTSADSLRFELDATRARIVRPDFIRAPAGEPASVLVDLLADQQADRLKLSELQVQLGPISVHADGEMPYRALQDLGRQDQSRGDVLDPWAKLLREVRGQIRVAVRASEGLTDYLPFLSDPMRDIQAAGPLALEFGVDKNRTPPRTSTVRVSLNMPESASLTVGEKFIKPKGQPVAASAMLVLDHESQITLSQIGLDLRCGSSRAWIDPAGSKARLAIQRMPPEQSPMGNEGVGGRASRPPAGTGSSPSVLAGGTPVPPTTTAPEDRLIAQGYLSAAVRVEKVETLLAAMPQLARRLEAEGVEQPLKGDCSMRFETNLSAAFIGREFRPRTWRAHAEIEASRLAIDLGERLDKPQGGEAAIGLDHLYDSSSPGLQHRHSLSFRLRGAAGEGVFGWGDGAEQAQVKLDITDLEQALRHAPSLQKRLSEYRLEGGASVAIHSRRDSQKHLLAVAVDAARLGVHLPGRDPIDKAPGVPCRFAATMESLPEKDASSPHEMAIREVIASIASCQLRATDGRIVTQPGTHEKLTGDYMARNPRWWTAGSPFREANLSASGTIVFDSTLRSLSPVVDRLARKYDLIGAAETDLRFGIDARGVRLAGRIDADRMNLNASPHMVKTPGTRMGITFDVASREQADREGTTTAFIVRECGLSAWDMRLAGSGDFWLQTGPEGAWHLGGFNLAATYDVPELGHLQKLVPSLPAEPLAGSIRGSLSLAAEAGQYRMGTSRMEAQRVRTTLADSRVELDGQVEVSSDRIDCDEMRLRIGTNLLKLTGHIEEASRNPKGTVFVISDELDIDQLRQFMSRLEPAAAASQPSDRERIIRAQPVFEFLKRCDLTGRAHIGEAHLIGEKTRKRFAVRELISDFRLAAGRVTVPFTCEMNGGLVDGEFSLTADQRNPFFDLAYKGAKVAAEDNVRAMVLYDFPGLHASGSTTLIDHSRQRFFQEPDVLNYPVGDGEMIIEGGSYIGRSAPLWLTRIFPGLNTAKYEFTRMHDWFKKREDGIVDHHMIYQGKTYNIYMKGHSLPDGRSYYEVGIDLLAGYESRYWSETGQGRVALFTADALVENGVEVRKDIQFVPLHRVIYDVFFRSNVVTAAYYTVKKRVTGAK